MDIYQSIWDADLEGSGFQPILTSENGDKTQGFVLSILLVGLSAEGLLALGTVRALLDGLIPDEIMIHDKRYKLDLFRSPDKKSIRTFYPIPIT